MKNVMIDLETLGNNSNAVIVSIGAVCFSPEGLGSEFYAVIDPESCVEAGLKMDTSTVMWWLGQSDEARKAITAGPKMNLVASLLAFSRWIPAQAEVWGNGAAFDNVILSNAYSAAGLPKPWSYSADRCYRTLRNLRPEMSGKSKPGEVAHNALSDAKYQARFAVELLNSTIGPKSW